MIRHVSLSYFPGMKQPAKARSELVLNADGSVYHLKLKDEHIANTVILVGDQDRVPQVSRHFDTLNYQGQNREFVTHTGQFGGQGLSVISTGIGTDNIDIVLNELFAAVNIDPITRLEKSVKRSLKLIRLGTTGAIHSDIEVGDIIRSSFGLGLDGQMYFYNYPFGKTETALQAAFLDQIDWPSALAVPYFTKASSFLQQAFSGFRSGITASGSGFYGPQGRNIRTVDAILPVQERLSSFQFQDHRITNFDMETSSLYGLGRLLGFECLTLNVAIANRMTGAFAEDHTPLVNDLIAQVLQRV